MARRPFLVLALPRSRTCWLSHYLCRNGEFQVGHDLVVECNRISDFTGSFSAGLHGSVETGAVVGWRLLRHLVPDLRLVTLHRPLEEVFLSLARLGITPDEKELEVREAMLEACAELPDTESLDWQDLSDPDCCKWLFELLLESEWDPAWHARMEQLNIQIDMFRRLQRLAEQRQQLEWLRAEVLSGLAKLPEGDRSWMQ